MKFKIILASLLFGMGTTAFAQQKATVAVHNSTEGNVIPKEIYGQFAEHLGSCIYGGLWVGEDSKIPNTNGYRNDVVKALKDLKVPVLRWPGGCFADEYHWVDGIGPKENRPRMVNNNWGGTVEDNSFGTHEFLNLCEILGCEPYVSLNVGSGSVEEMAKWVEYMTAEDGPQAKIRKANGREKPWHVKYIGVGNESWGCGGNMRPEYYGDLYRRYSTYCREFNGNKLYKIASGASDYDLNWTEVLMKNVGRKMDGLSLHYYTVLGWNGSKGKATKFTDDDYYWCLGKCCGIDSLLQKHIKIMDKYDPKKQVALLVDEWGTWWDVEDGTNPGHLFQQNTMRDAMVASLSLDIFHKYTERVKMTNIAQVINVLQSMILTKEDKMVLTPTYYVFQMYNVHQDAKYIPVDITCESRTTRNERKNEGDRTLNSISSTVSVKDGVTHVSLTNVDLAKSAEVTLNFDKLNVKSVSGTILNCKNVADFNSFEKPDVIKPAVFKDAKVKKNVLTVKMPAHSIVTLELK